MEEKPLTASLPLDVLANRDWRAKSQAQSIFFRLPPEIRRQTYIYALAGVFHVDYNDKSVSTSATATRHRLSLLITCGQM